MSGEAKRKALINFMKKMDKMQADKFKNPDQEKESLVMILKGNK